MRRLAPLFLLLLLAAVAEPIFTMALSNPMPCCVDGAAMCCPLPGQCAFKSCRESERDARLTNLVVFVLASGGAPAPSADASNAPEIPGGKLEPGSVALFDPPPRA